MTITSPNPQTENYETVHQYLHHIVTLDLPIQEKIALIDIVRSILSHFVDQAFHAQTDQITLQSAANVCFNGADSDANTLGTIEP